MQTIQMSTSKRGECRNTKTPMPWRHPPVGANINSVVWLKRHNVRLNTLSRLKPLLRVSLLHHPVGANSFAIAWLKRHDEGRKPHRGRSRSCQCAGNITIRCRSEFIRDRVAGMAWRRPKAPSRLKPLLPAQAENATKQVGANSFAISAPARRGSPGHIPARIVVTVLTVN